ncbi:MAG: O-methyltransferase [Nonlabens sp.]
MYFLPQQIDDYIVGHSEKEPAYLKDLTRETYQKVLQPIMLSGPYQGRVLSMLSHLQAPRRVLEIGTFTGYSALCLAEGIQDHGELVTIDINEELESMVERYFLRFRESVNPTIKFQQIIGDATDIIEQLPGTYDLIFIDADKPNYLTYLELVMKKVQPGSLIITDNVLWHGKVVENLGKKDISTRTLLDYNDQINNHPRLKTTILPVRDGLTLSRVL